MTLQSLDVNELLPYQLKIEDSVIAYKELQLGMQRNTRFGQHKERVRLGLQVSPENFFYDEDAFAGAPYVNLNALEFTMVGGTAADLVYTGLALPSEIELWNIVGGEEDPSTPGSLLAGSETCKSALMVATDLIEQVEIREGDTYVVCDAVG